MTSGSSLEQLKPIEEAVERGWRIAHGPRAAKAPPVLGEVHSSRHSKAMWSNFKSHYRAASGGAEGRLGRTRTSNLAPLDRFG